MPYFFRLPSIIELTPAQQSALSEPGPIAVSGGPGTGKSVVSLWRHIRNYETNARQSLLLTYTITLERYLAECAKLINTNAGNHVNRTYWWTSHTPRNYDEIIIDEAQDIEAAKYETIKRYAGMVSYGADDQQIVYKNKATTEKELATIFTGTENFPLDENFRNSYEILLFVKSLFPQKSIPQHTLNNLLSENRRGIKPQIIVTGYDTQKKKHAITDIIRRLTSNAHNIAILVPIKKNVKSISDLLSEANISFSSFITDDGELVEIENVHVTTFKSSKGTEFDTVIIPDFHDMKRNVANLNIIDENDYYVGLTRAKRNLFLISSFIPNFLQQSNAQQQTYELEIQ